MINKFKATNAGHKDMLAVLAAVTEVKQMQIYYDVNAEYFNQYLTLNVVSAR